MNHYRKQQAELTAMEIAMREAGIVRREESARAGLRQLARDAWIAHPQDVKARRAFITNELCAEFTYAGIQDWQPHQSYLTQMVSWILADVLREDQEKKAAAEKPTGADAAGPEDDRHPGTARPAANPSPDEGRQTRSGTKSKPATSVDPLAQPAVTSSEPKGAAPAAPPPHMKGRLEARLETFRYHNPFDTILINGRKLGDCTFDEAEAYAKDERHKWDVVVRFVRGLRADRRGDDVIRYWYTDKEEVERIWREELNRCPETV